MLDLVQKYNNLKIEAEQLLQMQVPRFNCTLRQIEDEVAALRKNRGERGGLSPTENARLDAISQAPGMSSLSLKRGEMYGIYTKWRAAKDDLEEFEVALSNYAPHFPKMVDATAALGESAEPNTAETSPSAQVPSIDTFFDSLTSKNSVALTQRRVRKPPV